MTESSPFDLVSPPLRRALEEQGFDSLTVVQSAILEALAASSEPENLRISSQTGSGKTVALGLAVAAQLLANASENAPGPRALIITPTRELAAQVQSELQWLFRYTSLTTDVVTGGTDVRREKRRLESRPDVLVATPGRLLDHMQNKNVDCSAVATVVLDEADQMLDMGFKDELDAIVDALPTQRLSHLVSATFSDAVKHLAQRFQGQARIVEGTKLGAANADIEHVAYLVDPREKYAALVNILLHHFGERCLVFVQTRTDTSEVAERLAEDGFSALPFSGDLAQAQRARTLSAFKNGIVNTLVATDVAARGIDVPGIRVVVHGDLPKETDVYTHRSGRTGRAGQSGTSISIVVPRTEMRARRLFQSARVDIKWSELPTGRKIRQRITKATRRNLYDVLQTRSFDEAELEYAKLLLEREDPTRVVATLLTMAETRLPRDAFDIKPVEPTPARAPRGPRASSYTRFSINWGAKQGANTNRVLSHVCRRGEVRSADIGSIEVNTHNTLIEINSELAADFERKVKKPDTRDPGVIITRDRSAARPSSDRRARPGAPRPHVARELAGAPRGGRVQRAERGKRTRQSAKE